MKNTLKYIALFLAMIIAVAVFVSCDTNSLDNGADADVTTDTTTVPMASIAGKYEANTHFSHDWEPGDSGKKIEIKKNIRAELILDESGVYTYNCYNLEVSGEFESHYQKGRYSLVGNEITFIPSEHWGRGEKGGVWNLSEMTAEESEKWTGKGSFEEGTVKISFPWYFGYPDFLVDQTFTLVSE